MLCDHFLFEQVTIKGPWFTTFLRFDERSADLFNVSFAGSVAAGRIADILAVIRELASRNLSLDPVVLLVGNGDRFMCRPHKTASISSG